MKAKKRLFYALMILPLVCVLCSLPFLPEQIPAHFSADNQVDRWGSKFELLLLPACAAVIGIIALGMARLAARQEGSGKNNESVCLLTGILLMLMFNCMTGYMLVIAYRQIDNLSSLAVDTNQLCALLLGLVLIVTGNIMPKTRMNSVFGLRTTWSSKNDTTWKKSQRFGGISLIIAGAADILLGLFVKGIPCSLWMLGILLAVTVIDTIYTYYIAQKY